MCPRSATQFENIRKEKKQIILDSALLVFGRNGYHAASISNIAKEAGISKGLIYNYFPSKEAILIEIITKGMEIIFSPFIVPEKTISIEEFGNLIDLSFDLIDENPSYWRVYFSLLFQAEVMPLLQTVFMEYLMPAIQNLARFFGQNGFENPLEEARFFGSMLDGLSLNYLIDPETFPRAYCINRIKTMYHIPQ